MTPSLTMPTVASVMYHQPLAQRRGSSLTVITHYQKQLTHSRLLPEDRQANNMIMKVNLAGLKHRHGNTGLPVCMRRKRETTLSKCVSIYQLHYGLLVLTVNMVWEWLECNSQIIAFGLHLGLHMDSLSNETGLAAFVALRRHASMALMVIKTAIRIDLTCHEWFPVTQRWLTQTAGLADLHGSFPRKLLCNPLLP